MLVKETVENGSADSNAGRSDNDISLRPLSEGSIYRHFEWSNDLELNRLQSELPFEEEGFSEFKRRYESLLRRAPEFERHFEIVGSGAAVIGVAHVGRISSSNRNCQVSVTIGDQVDRGHGNGRAALTMLLDYCFETLEMHRVSADAFAYNDPWITLLEKAGFKREGVERDYLYRDGRFWDKAIYGLLEAEYRRTE
jgi:RimJ/RimL family protein N-acetyltransferase